MNWKLRHSSASTLQLDWRNRKLIDKTPANRIDFSEKLRLRIYGRETRLARVKSVRGSIAGSEGICLTNYSSSKRAEYTERNRTGVKSGWPAATDTSAWPGSSPPTRALTSFRVAAIALSALLRQCGVEGSELEYSRLAAAAAGREAAHCCLDFDGFGTTSHPRVDLRRFLCVYMELQYAAAKGGYAHDCCYPTKICLEYIGPRERMLQPSRRKIARSIREANETDRDSGGLFKSYIHTDESPILTRARGALKMH